ncbi:TPA: hypothetical protein ACVOYJ_004523 [Vibrio diabolicus]
MPWIAPNQPTSTLTGREKNNTYFIMSEELAPSSTLPAANTCFVKFQNQKTMHTEKPTQKPSNAYICIVANFLERSVANFSLRHATIREIGSKYATKTGIARCQSETPKSPTPNQNMKTTLPFWIPINLGLKFTSFAS